MKRKKIELNGRLKETSEEVARVIMAASVYVPFAIEAVGRKAAEGDVHAIQLLLEFMGFVAPRPGRPFKSNTAGG